jgi:hypothetical protein
MRLTAFLYCAAVILGIAGVVAGQFVVVPSGFFHFGVGLIGIGFALGGLESVMQRRIGFRMSDDGYQDYDGVPALIVGSMALLVGAAIIAAAYLHAEGQWSATLNTLARRPGPALGAAGFLLGGTGVLMMLSPRGRQGWAWALLVRAPKILLGLALLLAGLAVIALGAWEFVQPLAFDRFVRTLPSELHWLAR